MYRLLRGVSTKKNRANRWNDCHPRIWLQAGGDRAIAAGSPGSQADLKTGVRA
jgi:hypothetical protein